MSCAWDWWRLVAVFGALLSCARETSARRCAMHTLECIKLPVNPPSCGPQSRETGLCKILASSPRQLRGFERAAACLLACGRLARTQCSRTPGPCTCAVVAWCHPNCASPRVCDVTTMWTVVHRRLGASCTLGGLHQRVRTAKCASQELVGQLHGVWVHGDDEAEPRGRSGVALTPCSVLGMAAPTAALSPGQRGIHTAAQPHGGKDADSNAAADSSNGDGAEAPQSFAQRWFGPQTGHADASFTNRWAMALPAFFTHLCIGSPYSWSVVSGPLSREMGFVTSAAE